MRHISQKMIESFIDGSLDDLQLKQVLDHLDTCDACYDETEVYYMITIGLLNQDANTQASADLRADFRNFIQEKKKEVERAARKKDGISYLITVLIMLLLGLVYYLVV